MVGNVGEYFEIIWNGVEWCGIVENIVERWENGGEC